MVLSARWQTTAGVAAAMAMACAGLGATTSSAAASTSTTSTTSVTAWGHGQNMPGVAALDVGHYAGIDSISCGSAVNCSASGHYTDSSSNTKAFVADEVNGTWQNAQPIPGIAALGPGSGQFHTSLSCSSAGNCSVVGAYSGPGAWLPFVADEVHGTWQNAQPIPGVAALDTTNTGTQQVRVSCPSDGNCGAAGYFAGSSGGVQSFVANEVNGTWQEAQPVAGLALSTEDIVISSLSCPSAGNCSAAGSYTLPNSNGTGVTQGFTVDEVNGTWQDAQPVAGLAALNTENNAGFSSLSCPSAGNCSAAGSYYINDPSASPFTYVPQGFTVDEVNGIWGTAEPVSALGAGAHPVIGVVSCASPGNCGGAGSYTDSSGVTRAFVADEVNGTWGNFQEAPGTAAILPTSGNEYPPQISGLSCRSAGNCTGIGLFAVLKQTSASTSAYYASPFTINEVNGTWENVQPIPGIPMPGMSVTGMDYFSALSCPAAGTCTAGGAYAGTAGSRTFVVHEPVLPTATAVSLSRTALTSGSEQSQISVTVSAASGGTPTGTVTVSASGTTVCTVTLVSGTGSCTLAADQLPIGTYKVTASYSGDADFGPSVSPTQALTVKPDTVTLTSPGAQATTAGDPVDLRIQGTSGKRLPLSYTASGLPPGVSLSSGGLLTGWPEHLGTYQVRVTATDSLHGSGSVSFRWTVSGAPDSGPTGYLRAQSGGKCLNDMGNRSRNGNPVDLWTCHSTAKAQQWTLARDQTIRIHGKCLTASKYAGWQARIETCTGWASRRWELVQPHAVHPSAGNRPLALYNPASGLCLEPGSLQPNGAPVAMEPCDGHTDQGWTPPPGPIASEVAGKCATDSRNKSSNGNKIATWTCDGKAQQQWQVKTDGTIRIHGKCLTIAHNRRTAGSLIWLWNCQGDRSQQWRLIPSAGGTQLINPVSGLCLTDPRGSTANGTQLTLGSCTANPPANNWRVR